MDIKKILEYQKLDGKLFQIEKKLNQSENKKKCVELSNVAREAQAKSSKLEQDAASVAKDIEGLFAIADQNKLKIKQILNQNVEKMTEEQIESSLALRDKLLQNLSIIDKKATKLAETANGILSEFNKTKVNYKEAGEKYKTYKDSYDKEVAEASPVIESLKKELNDLEKGIDSKLLEEYKKRRNDRIFPVLVPLNNKCCGGCHMEVPASSLSKLEAEGILTCENCRRIIYN